MDDDYEEMIHENPFAEILNKHAMINEIIGIPNSMQLINQKRQIFLNILKAREQKINELSNYCDVGLLKGPRIQSVSASANSGVSNDQTMNLDTWINDHLSLIESNPDHYFVINLQLDKVEFVTKSKKELEDFKKYFDEEELKSLTIFHSSCINISARKKLLEQKKAQLGFDPAGVYTYAIVGSEQNFSYRVIKYRNSK